MKRYIVPLLFLSLWAKVGFAQDATSLTQAIHFIKLANTLRDVDKSQESINLLSRALPTVRSKNYYWESVAYELMGLCYKDLKDSTKALYYLQAARARYAKLKYVASAWAVNEIVRDISGKNVYAGIQLGPSDIKVAIFKTKYESDFYEKDIKSKFEVPLPTSTLEANASNSFQVEQDVLKVCLDSIQRYNVPNERIFIVLNKEMKEQLAKSPEAKQKLYAQLSRALPNAGPKIDTTLTAAREAELFTIGAIPRKVWPTTSALDLGRSSTMGGYFDANKNFHSINVPVGIETLVQEIDGKGLNMDDYKREAQKVVQRIADKDLKAKFSAGRGLQQRRTVGVGGETARALITYLHPEKAALTAVAISADDVERFKQLALKDYQALTHPDLSTIIDPALRSKAEKDIADIRDQISEKQLVAGGLWLDAMMKVYSTPAAPKRFVFIRNADIGWVTGKFLETISGEYEGAIAMGALYTR